MTSRTDSVRAWDGPTRLFHWALAILILCAWISFRYAEALGDFTLQWHRWNGYAILVLLTFRLMWGVVGSSTARFASFVGGPVRSAVYLLDLIRGRRRPFLGHNPLGSWMVLALLTAVGTQAGLGLITVEHNDLTAGPLYRLVSEATAKQATRWHLWLFYWVLLPLITIHVAANVLLGAAKGEPLIRAMITGRKPAADYEDSARASVMERPAFRAFVCLVLSVALIFGGISLVGGRLF